MPRDPKTRRWLTVKAGSLRSLRADAPPEAPATTEPQAWDAWVADLMLYFAGDTPPSVADESTYCGNCCELVLAMSRAAPGPCRRRLSLWCSKLQGLLVAAKAAGRTEDVTRIQRSREIASLLKIVEADAAFADGATLTLELAKAGHPDAHALICKRVHDWKVRKPKLRFADRMYVLESAIAGNAIALAATKAIAIARDGPERTWVRTRLADGDSTFFGVLPSLIRLGDSQFTWLLFRLLPSHPLHNDLQGALRKFVRSAVCKVLPVEDVCRNGRVDKGRDDIVQEVMVTVLGHLTKPEWAAQQGSREPAEFQGLVKMIVMSARNASLRKIYRMGNLQEKIQLLRRGVLSNGVNPCGDHDLTQEQALFALHVLRPRDERVAYLQAEHRAGRQPSPWHELHLSPKAFQSHARRLPHASDEKIFAVWCEAEWRGVYGLSANVSPWRALGLKQGMYYNHAGRLRKEFLQWLNRRPGRAAGQTGSSNSTPTTSALCALGGTSASTSGPFVTAALRNAEKQAMSSADSHHLSQSMLLALVDASRSHTPMEPSLLQRCEAHLDECLACRARLVTLIEQSVQEPCAPPQTPMLAEPVSPSDDHQPHTFPTNRLFAVAAILIVALTVGMLYWSKPPLQPSAPTWSTEPTLAAAGHPELSDAIALTRSQLQKSLSELSAADPRSACQQLELTLGATERVAPTATSPRPHHDVLFGLSHVDRRSMVTASAPRALGWASIQPVSKPTLSTAIAGTGQRPVKPTAIVPGKTRKVRSNESLESIAISEYGTASAARAIADFNHLPDPDKIYTGQILRLPALKKESAKERKR